MDIRKELKNLIKDSLKKLGFPFGEVNLEFPVEFSHGDYCSNIALIYSKEIKIKPVELANKIVDEIRKNKIKYIKKIEVAPPGFINFFLSKEFFTEVVDEINNKGENFGKNKILKGEKMIIEYTNPNPFKELHIGHFMSNTIGESISRIIEANGAEVKRANYQGDVGLHVAKTIWGMLGDEFEFPKNENIFEQVAYLGKCYAKGAKGYEAGTETKKEITEINKKVYEKNDKKINELYDWGRKASLDYFEEIYKKLGTKFNFYFFESETGKFGKEIVERGLKEGVFEKSEGAVIFKGEKLGFHTRVFINSENLPTYEAKELGLAKIKYDKYPYDKSIIITGNEVDDYFKILIYLINKIFPELKNKTKHISHGMLRLPTGKMSSRTGDVVTAESLIKKIKSMVVEKMEKSEKIFDKKTIPAVAEIVAIGALKYSILRQFFGRDIIFDFNKSISFEGDSGPYLQYTCVRAKSVLLKAKEKKITPSIKKVFPEIILVERLLSRFPEVIEQVEQTSNELSPQRIATYLIELASAFNNFYANHKIIEGGEEAPYRLALTSAVVNVLKNGLYILGINVPEKM